MLTDDVVMFAVKTPETDHEVLEVLRKWSLYGDRAFASIERVHAMPKQGVSSTFKFGSSYGALKMALAACQIPFDNPSPQSWQNSLSCRSGGDKNVTKRKAQELFPFVPFKITHANADALLLAEYTRRMVRARGGVVSPGPRPVTGKTGDF